MGYCVDMEESTLSIKKENIKEVMKIIAKLDLSWCDRFDEEQINYNLGLKYSVDLDDEMYSLQDIWEDNLRFSLRETEDYYIISDFLGEKLGDEYELFNAIAKYCKEDSYIEFYGEDGARFRYLIKNEKCEEQHQKLIWN